MSRFMAMGAALGLVVMLGCGGGEGQQQASSGEMETPATESQSEAQQQMNLPEGVTMDMVNQGKEIYAGAGLCYTCHGTNGEGVANLGANLTDEEWLHSDGSFEGIVQTVTDGVDTSASSSGTPMPPKGGSGITDDQVRAVAAYVFTLKG